MKKCNSQLFFEAFYCPSDDDAEDRIPPSAVEIPSSMLFGFGDRDNISSLSNDGQLLSSYQTWSSHNLSPKQSSVSVTMEYGTPTSSFPNTEATENQTHGGGGSSGSEQTDEESLEIEGGASEQSKSVDIRRMKRKASNRESARRSRKRKQAHLADLELQVDQLRGENQSLFKQLTGANQEFTEAVTNNRVLKSSVEKLRVQVKMAEDMVARGTLACSLDNILQSHVGLPHQNNSQLPHGEPLGILPPMEFPRDDVCYIGTPAVGHIQSMTNSEIRPRLNQSSPLESVESLDNHEGIIHSEVSACETEIWPWDINASTIGK